jgi:hypothetical protein
LLSPFELKSTLSKEHRSKGVRPHSAGNGGPRLTGRRRRPSTAPPEGGTRTARHRFSSHTHAVEFSRIGAGRAANEKASARARGLQFDGLRRGRILFERRRSWSVAGLSSPPFRAAEGV